MVLFQAVSATHPTSPSHHRQCHADDSQILLCSGKYLLPALQFVSFTSSCKHFCQCTSLLRELVLFILRYSLNARSNLCALQERTEIGMKTLRDLIMMRPKNRLDFLDLMLTFTSSDRPDVSRRCSQQSDLVLIMMVVLDQVHNYDGIVWPILFHDSSVGHGLDSW